MSDYQDKHSLNLHQKIAAIMGEIGAITKGGTNKEQHYSYIEYDQIAGSLRDKMSEYGLLVIPKMGKREVEKLKNAKGNTGYHVLIEFTMVVINADKPEDREEYPWEGEATDWSDKVTTKASTSADKYFLMRLFKISSKGDDPDASTLQGEAVGPPKPTDRQLAQIEGLFIQLEWPEDVRQKLRAKVKSLQAANDLIAQLTERVEAKQKAPDTPDDDVNQEPALPDDSLAQAEANVKAIMVDDDTKAKITERLKAIGLSGTGERHFLKETVDTPFTKSLTADQWMKLSARVDDALQGREGLPEEWYVKEPTKDAKSKAAGDDK